MHACDVTTCPSSPATLNLMCKIVPASKYLTSSGISSLDVDDGASCDRSEGASASVPWLRDPLRQVANFFSPNRNASHGSAQHMDVQDR